MDQFKPNVNDQIIVSIPQQIFKKFVAAINYRDNATEKARENFRKQKITTGTHPNKPTMMEQISVLKIMFQDGTLTTDREFIDNYCEFSCMTNFEKTASTKGWVKTI